MEDILVPLGVCVALPVLIVFLSTRSKIKQDELRAQVLMEAIRNNSNIDTEKLAESLTPKPPKKRAAIETLRGRLLRACIFTLIGLTLLLVAFIGGVDNEAFNSQQITVGGICLSVGIAFFVVYFTSRTQVMEEYKQELSNR